MGVNKLLVQLFNFPNLFNSSRFSFNFYPQ
jgi:hypothetical protein